MLRMNMWKTDDRIICWGGKTEELLIKRQTHDSAYLCAQTLPDLQHLCYMLLWTVFLFKKVLFYWSKVDLQCCVNFSCPAKWFSYCYTQYTQSFFRFFSILVYQGTLNISSLCHIGRPCCLSTLYIVTYVCQPHSPTPPLCNPLPLGNYCPWVWKHVSNFNKFV